MQPGQLVGLLALQLYSEIGTEQVAYFSALTLSM